MIRIECGDIATGIYIIVAMCGEMEKKELVKCGIRSERSMRDAVRKCAANKLVLEKKTPNGKLIRLSKEGYEKLSDIPALKKHYDFVSGNHKVKNTPEIFLRRKASAAGILYMLKNGFAVDNMTVEIDETRGKRRTPAAEARTVQNPEAGEKLLTGIRHLCVMYESANDMNTETEYGELLNRTPEMYINFFTGRYAKELSAGEHEAEKGIILRRSRAKGHVIGNGESYAAYVMQSQPMQINEANERLFGKHIDGLYRKAYGIIKASSEAEINRCGNALIFSEADIRRFVSYPKPLHTEPSVQMLSGIFSQIHFIDIKGPGAGVDLITAKDWHGKILRKMYTKRELDGKDEMDLYSHCNAVVGGLPSIDLFSMDICKIERSFKTLQAYGGIHILCEPCKEEIVREIYSPFSDKKIEIEKTEL